MFCIHRSFLRKVAKSYRDVESTSPTAVKYDEQPSIRRDATRTSVA